MAHLKLTCFVAIVVCLVLTCAAPQFGGFSQANAQAKARGIRSLHPQPIAIGPGFAPKPPIFGGHGGAPNISISKSVSISTGGRGGSQSSASSNASGK